MFIMFPKIQAIELVREKIYQLSGKTVEQNNDCNIIINLETLKVFFDLIALPKYYENLKLELPSAMNQI